MRATRQRDTAALAASVVRGSTQSGPRLKPRCVCFKIHFSHLHSWHVLLTPIAVPGLRAHRRTVTAEPVFDVGAHLAGPQAQPGLCRMLGNRARVQGDRRGQ